MNIRYISHDKYRFCECFGFHLPKEKKAMYIASETLKTLPIFSIVFQSCELVDTLKKRNFYNSHRHENYVYDVRFSYLAIAKHIINFIGIGILILPLRITATSMQNNYLAKDRRCENPHLLSNNGIMDCIHAQINPMGIEKFILSVVPEAEDYAKRMAYRDHAYYPYYHHKSVYKDPLAKPGDEVYREKIDKFKENQMREIEKQVKQKISGTHVKPIFNNID